MTGHALITANVLGLPGDDGDGIHALIVGYQHNRALGDIRVRRLIRRADIYAVEIRYPLAGGLAEVFDAAERLTKIPRAVEFLNVATP